MKSDTPKGKSAAQQRGFGSAQEDRGSLLPSSWHILVLSWLWQAPKPLASVIRPWQAWPLSDCSSHWQADWLTDCPPTIWNLLYLCLFTPVHSHIRHHSMQKCQVCTRTHATMLLSIFYVRFHANQLQLNPCMIVMETFTNALLQNQA